MVGFVVCFEGLVGSLLVTLFVYLFICLCVCLIVSLFVCLFFSLLVCLLNCWFVHLLVNDVSVDRNCMYHGILYQLESNGSCSASVTEIGEMTASNLEKHCDFYSQFLII